MKRILPLFCLLLLGCPPDPDRVPDLKRPPVTTPSTQPAEVAAVFSGTAVVLILDTSGSMSGEKLQTVKSITSKKIANKLDFFALDNRLDVAVVNCGGSPDVPLPMAAYDSDKFKMTVAGLDAGGGTPLARALIDACVQLGKSKLEDRHIFVLSDGQGNSPVDPVLAIMKKRGLETVQIHVIGFKSDASYYEPFKKVGAQILMAEDKDTLDDAMSVTFRTILKLEADDGE